MSLGNGDGTFQAEVFYPAGSDQYGKSTDVTVGDFNDDGILDSVLLGSSGVWLFTGKGDGTFSAGILISPLQPPAGGYPGQFAAADFNGDGKLDLAVDGLATGGFSLIFGNGDGTFQIPKVFAVDPSFYAVTAGKLTARGCPGIALTLSDTEYLALFFSDGAGDFTGPDYAAMPGAAGRYGLGIADINGDGIPDSIESSRDVAYGKGGGKFKTAVNCPIQGDGGIFGLTLADLLNNGRTDIITAGTYGVSVLLNEGKAGIKDGVWTSLSSSAGCGVTADFNLDGKPDVAVVDTASGIQILLGTGYASKPFTLGQSISQPDPGCLTSTGDLNGDGIPNLAIETAAGVVSYLGNGDGTALLRRRAQHQHLPSPITWPWGDFNHDGILDFVTAGNLLALGNGDGTFQTPVTIASNPPSTIPVEIGCREIGQGNLLQEVAAGISECLH